MIVETDETRSLELAGSEAVVLGFSEDEGTHEKWVLVQVGDLPAAMLPSSSLERTGRALTRDQVYPGDKIRVTARGCSVHDGPERGGRPDGSLLDS